MFVTIRCCQNQCLGIPYDVTQTVAIFKFAFILIFEYNMDKRINFIKNEFKIIKKETHNIYNDSYLSSRY